MVDFLWPGELTFPKTFCSQALLPLCFIDCFQTPRMPPETFWRYLPA